MDILKALREYRDPLRQLPPKKVIRILLGFLLVIVSSGFAGGIMGYYAATGEYPPFMTGKTIAVLPPDITTDVSLVDIGHFLERDKTNEIDYGDDFNCVESAILLARNAHWQGLPAESCRLLYEGGSGHLILMFATNDSGWVFVDPQTDEVIQPRVGKIYNGARVLAIETLSSTWIPVEFEEVDN